MTERGRFSRIRERTQQPFAIFVSAATDLTKAFQASFLVGFAVLLVYAIALLYGLLLGEFLNDAFEVPLTLLSIGLPFPIDLAFDIISYLVLMWAGLASVVFFSRLLLRSVAWAIYSMGKSATFWWLNVAALILGVLFLVLAIWPEEYAGGWIVSVTGYAFIAALFSLFGAIWIWQRYRVDRKLRGRDFDQEVGGALWHLSEMRDFSEVGAK